MKKIRKFLLAPLIGILSAYGVICCFNPANWNKSAISLFALLVLSVVFTWIWYTFDVRKIQEDVSSKGVNKSILLAGNLILSAIAIVTMFRVPAHANFLLKISAGIGLFAALFLVTLYASLYILKSDIHSGNVQVKKRKIFLYALPCILVWILYLLAFYPGVMTYDSILQWGQNISHKYSDWHPVVHTWFMWFVTRLWYSPAAVALTQILILAFIFAYGMVSLEKAGIDKRLLNIITGLFCLSPVNGMMIITLWKDVLFSAFVLLFTFIMINIAISDGKWLNSRFNVLVFIITSCGIMFFRHNGKFCIIPTLILLIYLYRSRIKQLAILSLTIFLLFFIFTGPVFSYMKVKPAFEGEQYSVPLNILGAVVKNGGNFNKEQVTEINRIMPLDQWRKTYNPFIADPVKIKVNYDVFLKNKKDFLMLLLKVSVQNPKAAIKGFADLTSIVWRIPLLARGYTATPSTGISKNNLNLKSQTKDLFLHNLLSQIYDVSKKKLYWLFWRPALPMLIILLSSFLMLLKNKKNMLPVFSVILLNIVTILIAVPAQDFRYLYTNSLAALPFIAFSFIKLKNSDEGIKH